MTLPLIKTFPMSSTCKPSARLYQDDSETLRYYKKMGAKYPKLRRMAPIREAGKIVDNLLSLGGIN